MSYLTLFRPVGTAELILVDQLHWEAFPPRLPEQPIFYPVLELDYARQIARDWNSKREPDLRGYVTKFNVLAEYAAQFEPQVVGNESHRELWVPAEELPVFNANISRKIEVIEEYLEGKEVSIGYERPDLQTLRARARHYPPDALCGCYYCMSTYLAREITEWVYDSAEPICPQCSVDAVLSAADGYRVSDQDYLRTRHERSFGHD